MAHSVGALAAVLAAEQQRAAQQLTALHQDADQALAERPEVQDLEEVGPLTSFICSTSSACSTPLQLCSMHSNICLPPT